MGVTILRGCSPAVLFGGLWHGHRGEVVNPPPPVLTFDVQGVPAVYRLQGEKDGRQVYAFSRKLSPELHRLMVEADRQAVIEVAEQRGVPPQIVLEEARQRKATAGGEPHPADALLAEAAELGVPVEDLLTEKGLWTHA